MGDLPIGVQQLVEITRVLFSGARIIILDEPTSALSPPEVERLFAILRRLREEGRSIVFISHFIDDILRVSDLVTVFRNGRKVAEMDAGATSKGELIEAMIGRGGGELEESYLHDIALPAPSDQPVVLKVDHLSLGRSLRDVSLEARSGEVLGIYGFMGCGQLDLARVLFGKLKARHGELAVDGRKVAFASTASARRAGIAFVPESRRAMLFHQEPVYKNVSISILDRISRLLLKPSRERALAERQVTQLQIRPPVVDLDLGMLSGGNQQKVGLAKWLSYPPKLLILCEPTRGMDVGAKNDVVNIVRDLKSRDPVLYGDQHFEAIKPVGSKIFSKARIVRQAAGIDSKMFCYDFTDLDDEIALHDPAPCTNARTRITASQRLQERIGFTTGHEIEVPYVRYRTVLTRRRDRLPIRHSQIPPRAPPGASCFRPGCSRASPASSRGPGLRIDRPSAPRSRPDSDTMMRRSTASSPGTCSITMTPSRDARWPPTSPAS